MLITLAALCCCGSCWVFGLHLLVDIRGEPAGFVSIRRRRLSWSFMGTPAPIELSTIGMADSLILMVLALVVFGPRKLPQIGRQIGKLMYEFRKASNDFKFQMEEELRLAEESDRKQKDEAQRQKTLTEQSSVHAQPLVDPTVDRVVDSTPEQTSEPAPNSTIAPTNTEAVPEVHVPRMSEPVTQSVSVPGFDAGPVVRPPSTGETIAAAKPGASPAQASAETSSAETPEITSPTETVSQHG
jgi:sec-independent protein translocase protein TatB